MAKKRQKPSLRRFGEDSLSLWKFIGLLILISSLVAWYIVERATNQEKTTMLYDMNIRAQSLGWAIEGGLGFLPHGYSQMLTEMGRQPGVAWIALVDSSGRITGDSNSALEGALLYTPQELALLDPTREVKGRFSPDDPNIYETWMLFAPQRVKRKEIDRLRDASYLFIGLDATDFRKSLEDYRGRMITLAALIISVIAFALALIFYIYNYRSSRRKLLDARAWSEQIINSYPAALLVTDSAGKIMFMNGIAKQMFALSDEPINLNALPGLDWTGFIKNLQDGQPVLDRERRLLKGNKNSIPVSISGRIINSVTAHDQSFLFTVRDLEEISTLKQKLAESRRLSSLGKLAAGLAHEIRNPLSSICGYAHYLGQKLASDPMGLATAKLLGEEAQRLNGVLTDLLSFAKPDKLRLKRQSLNELLKKAMFIVQQDGDSAGIKLRLDLPPETAGSDNMALVDGDKMIQALLNLLLNAIQATPPGGEVVLKLERVQSENNSSPGWRLEVQDNGPGMNEDVLSQIFTPYFTTRAEGSGLGLTLALQIVENHGGSLTVASAPGQGSVFTISLPEQDMEWEKTN